ncbi:FAD/NAD(P)-binding oxidoreductase [Rhodanobacter sp. AS-Z3]|uniref:NAD(P)/FAD-dependent oxidoreductase n=1 Tax=Rhodanobacter sp. AS-Z3 TaxID=3031330 RepID=UPI002479A940|nr:FAD/NAD(P)-binding oxidoreductase [Rhodanobacter sp. AS-Z3]WEN15029.1 FAD/NAD(P)-binding oxidoreductase [Rhodanobacter sp. AS-Z3]
MTEHFDVLVVGAGPAGLAAAHAAAGHGVRVGLLDAQPRQGGQIWRHDARHGAPQAATNAITALANTPMPITWLAQHQVIGADEERLLIETPQAAVELSFGSLVVATGARELLLPFPGWTLPGVTGAGGLQALAKQGWPVQGKRVVVAGSGPLLWATAATLRRHGAHVLGIHEQASAAAVRAFAMQLWRWPARAVQAVQLRALLHDVSYHCGSFVRRAHGDTAVTAVEVVNARGVSRIDCDLLAVGYGLVPNVELPGMLGCTLDRHGTHPAVQVDGQLRTSVANIYAAGESCGIAGLPAARIEGRLAGHMAAGATAAATPLLGQRRRARRFAELLDRHFALNPQLQQLAELDTIVCRCEDVTLGALAGYTDARAARLATRCGMGACQGRICGTALAELGRFPCSGNRPPIFPARLATLAGSAIPSFLSHDSGDNHA